MVFYTPPTRGQVRKKLSFEEAIAWFFEFEDQGLDLARPVPGPYFEDRELDYGHHHRIHFLEVDRKRGQYIEQENLNLAKKYIGKNIDSIKEKLYVLMKKCRLIIMDFIFDIVSLKNDNGILRIYWEFKRRPSYHLLFLLFYLRHMFYILAIYYDEKWIAETISEILTWDGGEFYLPILVPLLMHKFDGPKPAPGYLGEQDPWFLMNLFSNQTASKTYLNDREWKVGRLGDERVMMWDALMLTLASCDLQSIARPVEKTTFFSNIARELQIEESHRMISLLAKEKR